MYDVNRIPSALKTPNSQHNPEIRNLTRESGIHFTNTLP